MIGEPTNAPCRIAPAALFALLACAALHAGAARAATLSEKAKESGCMNRPVAVTGTLYKCMTASGDPSYFNVPGAPEAEPAPRTAPRAASAPPAPSPPGFPKVDAGTQKGRDDIRRKVLSEELATEEKLLVEAKTAYADGAPTALPEEKSDVEKYRDRIARLRQAVGMHEKNVEALKKELASVK